MRCEAQLDQGIEIGPQTPLAGEVAERVVSAMVGMDRVAFCNTGSEAVTAAIRVARTVSGRDKIAMFAGAYHGIFDEVLVRAAGFALDADRAGHPAQHGRQRRRPRVWRAPRRSTYLEGPRRSSSRPCSSSRSRAADRSCSPASSSTSVRRLTEASDTALVFDEVVTGFRSHAGGAQAIFGVRADIATYGKVIGGGLPIGLVAGRPEYLDALDGGAWEYGDDSIPEVGVTFFAGTFVRHPLALAAARAVLDHLETSGPDLQRELNLRTTAFVARLDAHARSVGAPVRITHFSSWMCVNFPATSRTSALFYAMMRDRGVHIWEGRCWFLTTAHTRRGPRARLRGLPRARSPSCRPRDLLPGGVEPPVPGARLGQDADGREAWFVPIPTARESTSASRSPQHAMADGASRAAAGRFRPVRAGIRLAGAAAAHRAAGRDVDGRGHGSRGELLVQPVLRVRVARRRCASSRSAPRSIRRIARHEALRAVIAPDGTSLEIRPPFSCGVPARRPVGA